MIIEDVITNDDDDNGEWWYYRISFVNIPLYDYYVFRREIKKTNVL